jgi:hypothetical protein
MMTRLVRLARASNGNFRGEAVIDTSHLCTRARHYRDAAERLREAADLAGEAGASQDTIESIQALADRMARAADDVSATAR